MRRTALISLAAAMTLSLALASPAAAFQIVKQSGQHGDYGSQSSHDDDSNRPGARCGYSAADSGGTAYLRWIKVYHFLAAARDITAGRDSQLVSLQVSIQRQVNGGSWHTVASSSVQKLTAHDDQSPNFSDPKVAVHGTSGAENFRALLTLKWWRNGTVEGSVKVRLEYYSVKWTVGQSDYVFTDACGGAAD